MKQYVILSHARWSSTPSRIQHLATRMRDAEIFFFQPAGPKREETPQGRQVRPGLSLYTLPPEGPLERRFSPLERLSARRQATFVEKQLQKREVRRPILWLTRPDQVLLLEHLRYSALIYDCDRFWPAAMEGQESELACAADLILAASPQLKRRLSPCSANIALVPNGVNFPMFSRPDPALPQELAALPGPLLGWAGSIDEGLDLSPVLAIARQRPDWSVILLGPVRPCAAVKRLAAYPNVHFLGHRPFLDVPDYLSHCAVLLDLRRREEVGSDIIPSRVYEYLSTGRPIVSHLPAEQVEPFPDVIYAAHEPVEFVRLCEQALMEDPGWVSDRRREHGANAAWSLRAESVRAILAAIAL